MIVSKQRSHSIPTNPPVLIPVQKALPQLGTKSPYVVTMYAAHLETSYGFEKHTRRTILEREAVGVREIYSNMKSTSATDIDKYSIGKRLEVCFQYFIDD